MSGERDEMGGRRTPVPADAPGRYFYALDVIEAMPWRYDGETVPLRALQWVRRNGGRIVDHPIHNAFVLGTPRGDVLLCNGMWIVRIGGVFDWRDPETFAADYEPAGTEAGSADSAPPDIVRVRADREALREALDALIEVYVGVRVREQGYAATLVEQMWEVKRARATLAATPEALAERHEVGRAGDAPVADADALRAATETCVSVLALLDDLGGLGFDRHRWIQEALKSARAALGTPRLNTEET